MPPCPPENPSNTPIQLKRSSTLHKRPLPECLREGQPAVNYNSGDPGLYFSDELGSDLIKIGPCHVGENPPNSPAVGSTGNSKGEGWLDTSNPDYPILKTWDGAEWRTSGYIESNIIWVDVNGDDAQDGLTPQTPKKTIKSALLSAIPGVVIRVSPGVYEEENPLIFPCPNVSIIGADPQSTVVEVANDDSVLQVRSGAYIENLSFTGTVTANKEVVSFVSTGAGSVSKIPVVKNCINHLDNSIGVHVDGDLSLGLKSITVQGFEQRAEGGIGLKVSNLGQLDGTNFQSTFVEKSVVAESGGTVTLTGCKSACGDYGIYSDGKGPEEQSGELLSLSGNVLELENLVEPLRPYSGQVVSVGTLYYKVKDFTVDTQGSGYTSAPTVTVSVGSGPNALPATGEAIVKDGKLDKIKLLFAGNGIAVIDTITVTLTGGGPAVPATASVSLEPIFYTVVSSSEIMANSCTVTIAETIPYTLAVGSSVKFYRASRVSSVSHLMEYVGCGTVSPYDGGVPLPENQVIAINGGKAYTSILDQSGVFSVGKDLVVDQASGAVYGEGLIKAILNISIAQSLTL